MNKAPLKEMIYRRRSVRKFTGQPVEEQTLADILEFCRTARPLDPEIRVRARIVSREHVRFYLPWKTPQLIAIFSENKPGYLENEVVNS